MALRLLEFTAPEEQLDQIPGLLEGCSLAHVTTLRSVDGIGLVRILLDAHDTEHVSDRIARAFSHLDDFRLILLPVQATLPTVDLSPEPATGNEGNTADKSVVGFRRISREELYEEIAHASRLTAVYAIMVALSTVVAAVGLIRDDLAIVIGAMVIAPLLGPNIGLSLAASLGDWTLGKNALKAIVAGVSLAGGLSLLMGALLTVDPAASALAARSQPGIGDVLLALSAGTAGALAFTSGVSTIVVGVMVAVALLPPLVVAGLLAGAGYASQALGASMLAFVNVTSINLAAVAIFFIQRVRPRTWWKADRARRATRIAVGIWFFMLMALVGLMLLAGMELPSDRPGPHPPPVDVHQ